MSPLIRRTPRELKNHLGKYLGIFLLMFACVAFTSGFLLAAHSILVIIDGMRDAYNIEDGRFTTDFELTDAQLAAAKKGAEGASGVTIYENYAVTAPIAKAAGDNGKQKSARATVYQEDFDVAVYVEGRAPQAANEIALARCFSNNNDLHVGDAVTFAGRPFTVSGIMTQADSQASFESNSDFTLNAVTFSVAQVSQAGLDALEDAGHTPAWTYSFCFFDRGLTAHERSDVEQKMLDALSRHDAQVSDLIDSSANQGIGYVENDAEGDSSMWETLLYILIVIMAFAFVVITAGTIEDESAIIGTLLASGYRPRELVAHYALLPCFVGLVACVAGTVCGVTLLEGPMKGLYYNSYDLPPYQMSWDWGIVFESAVVPFGVLAVITVVGVARKMGHTPLEFLRHETGRTGLRRAVKLPALLRFAWRFRLRVFLRNLGSFVTLFLGIAFASLLLLFGLAVLPTMENYADNLRENMVVEHQYTLKAPLELSGSTKDRESWKAVDMLQKLNASELSKVEDAAEDLGEAMRALSSMPSEDDAKKARRASRQLRDGIHDIADELGVSYAHAKRLVKRASRVDAGGSDAHPVNTRPNDKAVIAQAEKYAVTQLDYDKGDGQTESIAVYGISRHSRYWKDLRVGDKRVVFGRGVVEKFGLVPGDGITLYDKYDDIYHGFTFDPRGGEGTTWGSESDMSIYLLLEDFNMVFRNDAKYFNAYASDEPLQLDSRYLVNDLTPGDMDKIGDQMTNSMGDMMGMLQGLAVFIYLVFIYLLTKAIIERSARAISYLKVFGYRWREIVRLYLRPITWCVVVALLASLPVMIYVVGEVFRAMLMEYSGNIVVYVPDYALVQCVVMGLAAYAVVALVQMRAIGRVPLAIALKAQE